MPVDTDYGDRTTGFILGAALCCCVGGGFIRHKDDAPQPTLAEQRTHQAKDQSSWWYCTGDDNQLHMRSNRSEECPKSSETNIAATRPDGTIVASAKLLKKTLLAMLSIP
jgi:hypothetical protein